MVLPLMKISLMRWNTSPAYVYIRVCVNFRCVSAFLQLDIHELVDGLESTIVGVTTLHLNEHLGLFCRLEQVQGKLCYDGV